MGLNNIWRKPAEVSIENDGSVTIEHENVAEAVGFANAVDPTKFTVNRLGQHVSLSPRNCTNDDQKGQ